MGVLGYIKEAKKKFNEQKTRIRSYKTKWQKARVKSLVKERKYQEKSAILRLKEREERDRIARAKGIESDGGILGRGQTLAERLGAAGDVKSGIKGKGVKVKGRNVLDKSNPYQLGGGHQWGATGGGPKWSDIGAPTMKKKGGLNTSDRWSLGSSKKMQGPKRKRWRQIVINMR